MSDGGDGDGRGGDANPWRLRWCGGALEGPKAAEGEGVAEEDKGEAGEGGEEAEEEGEEEEEEETDEGGARICWEGEGAGGGDGVRAELKRSPGDCCWLGLLLLPPSAPPPPMPPPNEATPPMPLAPLTDSSAALASVMSTFADCNRALTGSTPRLASACSSCPCSRMR